MILRFTLAASAWSDAARTGDFRHLGAGYWVYVAILLALVLPGLAVQVRRLHDIDYSGAWWFIAFVPLAGVIVLIVFWATEGTRGPNKYGPDPKAA